MKAEERNEVPEEDAREDETPRAEEVLERIAQLQRLRRMGYGGA